MSKALLPYTKSVQDLEKHFKIKLDQGLSKKQIEEARKKYGRNELPEDPPTPLWELILEQFKDELVMILLIAAAVSFVLAFFEESDGSSVASAYVEPIVILLILIANAVVGVVQETNAEKAIEALQAYTPDEAKVVRNSLLQKVDAAELLPGDVVVLSVGDKIPADCRLANITSTAFRVDQAVLTGESVSVTKEADVVVGDAGAVKQDQVNMLFSGTTVTIGKAVAIVTAIGTDTAIGDIHQSISAQISEKTPLKKALDDFGDQLAKIITVICILVWLINIRHFTDEEHFHGNWLKGAVYYFKIAVALAVAAIPEGLAVVITTCLALGTRKMAAQGAIVRKLRSVETLGCTSVICSDKTGTLTTNQMSVRRFAVFGTGANKWQDYTVSGSTFSSEGEISTGKAPVDDLAVNLLSAQILGEIFAMCNEAQINYNAAEDAFEHVGEPTEAALKVLAEKIGSNDASFNETLRSMSKPQRNMAVNEFISNRLTKLKTLEFSRDRKSMSVLVRQGKKHWLHVKGAPESIIERCTHYLAGDKREKLTNEAKSSILRSLNLWAEGEALRVLAAAYCEVSNSKKFDNVSPEDFISFEQELTFVGLAGMLDPPRPGVKDAIHRCHEAGIRVVVITGDNRNTAEAICRQIGVFGPSESLKNKSFTGREFADMPLAAQRKAVLKASLFSRTEPAHKQSLVDLFQSEGFVVAMTGDGVNDAPALKKADIGVAMGSGTDVARLASDMVLADDNFATIVSAVEEGRSIYANTKQFIRYLISSNIGEVVCIFLTVLLGIPEVLIPVQLLWVNLVTDGLPATALGFNPADHDIMHQPPRDSKEPIVTRWLFIRYCVVGFYVGLATIMGYVWYFLYSSNGPQITFYQLSHFHKCASEFSGTLDCSMFVGAPSKAASTVSLSILVVVEMFNAMNSLSENESLCTFFLQRNLYLVGAIALSMFLHILILYVEPLAALFSITSLNFEEWVAVLAISFPVILIDEALKFISRNFVLPKGKTSLKKSTRRLKSD